MNYQALFHQSDSLYSFALDENTVELRLRAAKNDLAACEVIYGVKHEFYLTRSVLPMQKTASDGYFDYFAIRLKLEDKRLAYIFRVTDKNGERRYFSEDGATADYDFSLCHYNFFQLAYINKNDIAERVDWLSHAVVYQIFVDRFNHGNKPDGSPSATDHINLKWGDIPTPKSFAGGNLYGIADKLDYLCDLGVNTLYLTPIFKSVSNHKYDISDYFDVDPQFGGKDGLRYLVSECKARGMRIILDAVFNHCSENIAQFRDVVERGRQSPYFDWFIINGDKPTKKPLNYEVFSVCDYMPKWNTANPEVQEYLCGVGEYWIKEFGIDGWRLDVSDEVSHGFWRKFRTCIKQLGKDYCLIGEKWQDAQAYLAGDQFDSIMNYGFTKAMTDYFVNSNITSAQLAERLYAVVMRNITPVNYMMLNLLDCHDTHRFYSLTGRDGNKLLQALAIELFMPGAAMIYYGTEIPLEGGYDPDCRRCFDWNCDKRFTQRVRELLKFKKLRALAEGDVKFDAEGDVFIVERRANGQTVTLFVNNTDKKTVARGEIVQPHGYKINVE